MEKLLLLEKRWYHHPEFPCSVFRLQSSDLLFQTHWHDEIEWLYAVDCSIEVTIEGKCWTLTPGAAAVVNSGQLHAARMAPGQSGRVHILVFHPDIWLPGLQDITLSQMVRSILSGQLSLPILWTPEDPAAAFFLSSLQRLFDWEQSTDDHRQVAMRGEFYLLLAGLIGEKRLLPAPANDPPGRQHQVELIRKPLQQIQLHYQQDLPVRELAGLANLSESHFSRIFHKVLGQSVVEYLNEYRLRQAARLLDNTDARITDIALECGFPNISYFVRSFKQQYALTPTAYRRRTIG